MPRTDTQMTEVLVGLWKQVDEAQQKYFCAIQQNAPEESLVIDRGVLATRLVDLAVTHGNSADVERALNEGRLGQDEAFMTLYRAMLAEKKCAAYVAARDEAGELNLAEWLASPIPDLLLEAAQTLARGQVSLTLSEDSANLLLEKLSLKNDMGFQAAYKNARTYFTALVALGDYTHAETSIADDVKDTLRERAANLLAASFYNDYSDEVVDMMGDISDGSQGAEEIDGALKELYYDKIGKLGCIQDYDARRAEAFKRVENSPTRKVSDVSGSGSRILSMSNTRQQ